MYICKYMHGAGHFATCHRNFLFFPFYNVFLKSVLESERDKSGASEYEIYFNYILQNHSDKIKIRKWN